METIEDIVKWLRDNNPQEYYTAEYGYGEVPNKMRQLADRIEEAHKRALRCQREYLDKRYEESMNALIDKHEAIEDNLRKLYDPRTSSNADFVHAKNFVEAIADRIGASTITDSGFTTKYLEDAIDSLLRLRRNHVKIIDALRKRMSREADRAKEDFKTEMAESERHIYELRKDNDRLRAALNPVLEVSDCKEKGC